MTAVYIIRVAVKKLIIFILANLVLCALSIMLCIKAAGSAELDYIGITIVWAALSVLMLVNDIVFWVNAVNIEKNMPVTETGEQIKGFKPIFREGFAHFSVYFVGVHVIIMLLAIYVGLERLRMYSYVSGIIFVGLYFIRMYLRNVSGLMEVVEIGNGTTRRKLVNANTGIVIPFIIFIIGAMVLFQSDAVVHFTEQSVILIAKAALYVIFLVISLFSGREEEPLDMETGMMDYFNPGYGKNPDWLDAIYKFVENTMSVALLLFIVYLAAKLVIRLVKYYGGRSINTIRELRLGDMTEVSERIRSESIRKKSRRPRLFGRLNNRDKIRYMYNKVICKAAGLGMDIIKSRTPNERIADAKETMEEMLVNITPTYNKARYSNRDISDAEVNIMRKEIR